MLTTKWRLFLYSGCVLLASLFLSMGVFAWGGDEEAVPSPTPAPTIKLYSNQMPVLEAAAVNERNLTASDRQLAAGLLYDGNPETVAGSEKPVSVTLDAGAQKALTKIRFLPDADAENADVACIGARFLASVDNRDYVELARIEADQDGVLQPDWHEISFSGYGFYRYFRVELPAGAQLAEVEWIQDEGVQLAQGPEGAEQLQVSCSAFDAQRDFTGTVLFARYNQAGIMTQLQQQSISFAVGAYTPVTFITEAPLAAGDTVKIFLLEEDVGTAIAQPLLYCYTAASSELWVPNIFSDNMLLQADEPVTVWGKAPCGETVTVSLTDLSSGSEAARAQVTVTSPEGWEVELPPFSAGGSYRLDIVTDTAQLRYTNLTFGDVWLFMGQSNMEYYMLMGKDSAAELATQEGIAKADCPQIRLLNLWNKGTEGAGGAVQNVPLNDWDAFWVPMDVDRANYCSAIAYYFAQGVYNTYQRPVGILNVAVGDTEIDWWYPYGETNGDFTGSNGRLYNNRVAPFEKLKIKGILLYQGEADEYRTHLSADVYSDALAGLVDTCRGIWGESLPFYWAQLTRYRIDETQVREGQRMALQKVKNPENTGMVCLLDAIGSYEGQEGSTRNDIHPMGKEEVAQRFLAYAGRDVYGDETAQPSGPSYQSMQIVGNTIELTFQHTGRLQVMPSSQYADQQTEAYMEAQQLNPDELQEFWIAGADGVFTPAQAEIAGDKVVVWSEEVEQPRHVRYAWGAYPEMPNLTDETGLPCSTFSTQNGS